MGSAIDAAPKRTSWSWLSSTLPQRAKARNPAKETKPNHPVGSAGTMFRRARSERSAARLFMRRPRHEHGGEWRTWDPRCLWVDEGGKGNGALARPSAWRARARARSVVVDAPLAGRVAQLFAVPEGGTVCEALTHVGAVAEDIAAVADNAGSAGTLAVHF